METPSRPCRTSGLIVALVLLGACQGSGAVAQSRLDDAPVLPTAHRASPSDLVAGYEPRGDLRSECMRRRMALAERLGPGVVWLESAPATELTRFFQEDNFYYLTGVEDPEIAMAMLVDENGGLADEVLFLPPYDANAQLWTGRRLTPGLAAEQASGFRRTATLAERAEVLAGWAPTTIHAYPALSIDPPEGATVDTARLPPALAEMRLVKSSYEIDCLTRAIDVTAAGLLSAMKFVAPGNFEYQPQGALEGTFLALGAERPGFASIFGSGPNSVTLHYDTNMRRMQDGELIVMDVGAKFRYYCADVTRTVPVNGHFTPRQREVYELVLKAQTAAAQAARPGMSIADLEAIARQVIEDGGFSPSRRYFPHGLGHWIGLDVHDVGGRVPIPVNALFTIEPGIYIDEENLGVRIEDDYIMTPSGAVKVSDGVTSDPDELQALLAGA